MIKEERVKVKQRLGCNICTPQFI